MTLLPRILPRTDSQKQADLERSLIRREAELGGQLFGPLPKGHSRQFFCLDEHTWIWHEEWLDSKTGQRQSVTTRYDVRPNGVLKLQNGHVYQRLSRQEARNLYKTVQLYQQRVGTYYQQVLRAAA